MGFVIAVMVGRASLPGKLDPFRSLSELLTLILHSYHMFEAPVAKGTLLEIRWYKAYPSWWSETLKCHLKDSRLWGSGFTMMWYGLRHLCETFSVKKNNSPQTH